MSFCSLRHQNNGIFILTMANTYLTEEAITELVNNLRSVQNKPELKGLVTTSKNDSFCDGIDYDHLSEEQAAHLAQRMAEVVRLLFELPVPTASAVAGNATSLGLALALAHDHCVVWEDAVLRLPEAQRGRPLPDYVVALLRDKLAYSRLRKLLMLKSQPCSGKELAGTWYSAHGTSDDRHMVVAAASELLEGIEVGKGMDFATARQTMCRETCATVGVVTAQQRPRPSPAELAKSIATHPLHDTRVTSPELPAPVTDLPLNLLEKITKYFSDDQLLGSGGYGKVYKGVHENGEVIAVKKLYSMPGLNEDQFNNEFRNLMRLQHRNIVRLVGYCYDIRHKHVEHLGKLTFSQVIERILCFEYLQLGSLDKHLSEESCGLDWRTRYKVIKGICEGLKYLHEGWEHPTYHLDLKPANILLDEHMVPKIADFGLSRLFGSTQTHVTTNLRGTIYYVPPEYLQKREISNKFDVYSLGVIIIEIMTGPQGHSKWAEMSRQQFLELVQENWNKRLQETLGYTSLQGDCLQVKTCIETASKCMEVDRKKRPTIGEIVSKLNDLEITIQKMSSSAQ